MVVEKTVNILKILLCLLFIIAGAQKVFSQQKSLQEQSTKPSLKIISDSTNSRMVLQYTIHTPSFVELKIYDRLGEIVAAPVYAFQGVGEHSIVFDKNNLNAGSFSACLILNHDDRHDITKSFINKPGNRNYTTTRKEENYLNRAMMHAAESPENSKLLYDTLLTQYPNYIDRGVLFAYALSTYMMVSDSLVVSAIIDSLENYSPRSTAYLFISGYSAFLKKYLPIGIKYAQKAIDNINDIPEPYRNSYLFNYQRNLGQNYMASGNYDFAAKAFTEALTTYHSLKSYDWYVKYQSDVDLISNLGLIYENKKQHEDAITYYKMALTKDPSNSDNWLALQRVYIALNHSDEGYNLFKEDFYKTIPKENINETKTERFIGNKFPSFKLSTLEGKKYDDKDIKGKVTVINYWAYSCGYCLKERPDLEKLWQEFKGENFTLLSFHSELGNYGNYDEEKELLEKVFKKYPATFPTLIQSNDNNTPRIGIDSIPTTVIVDKKGVIRFEEIGYDQYQFYDRMKNKISQLLKEK